jgi:hypothetical protein
MSDQNDALMQDMFGVFNKKADEVNLVKEQEGGSAFFNPDAKKSPGQIFRGLVKFIPNLHDLNNMMVEKVTYWVPEGDKGFRFDSAKSLEKFADCPVNDAYWDMKNSDDARLKAAAEKIKYSRNTYVLVQVIKDLTNPDNNGKIMVWNVPFAIQKKIKAKMYPSKEDIEMSGAVANNVFDPINGLPMNLKIPIKTVTENGKTSEFRDYDECTFANAPVGVILDGEEKPLVISDNPEEAKKQQEAILKTILAGPNLQDQAYKTPSEAEFTRVHNAIAALRGGQPVQTQAQTQTKAQTQTQEVKTEAKVETKAEEPVKQEAQAEVQSENAQGDKDILSELGFDE